MDMVGERIEKIKVIRDWKTGVSEGYGFLMFYEPMVATSALESVRNLKIKGRVVRLDQGKKKDVDEDERLKKKKLKKDKLAKEDLDEEGNIIYSALEEVDGSNLSKVEADEKDESGFEMSEDDMITFMEKGGLRSMLPLTKDSLYSPQVCFFLSFFIICTILPNYLVTLLREVDDWVVAWDI